MKSKTTLALFFTVGVTACSGGQSTAPDPTEAKGATAPSTASIAAPRLQSDLPEGYMHVPNGVAMHGDCVHEVPKGAKVHANGDVTVNDVVVAHHDECAHPPIVSPRMHADGKTVATSHETPGTGGWIEAAWQYAPSGQQIVVSTSTFVVPPEPSNKLDPILNPGGQIVFLFPSVTAENANGTSPAIVQPVLQWGVTSPNGGVTGVNGSAGGTIGSTTSWTYAAWGVTSGQGSYFSNPITVNAGDTLAANMSIFAQSSTSVWWVVEAIDQTTGNSTWDYVEFPLTASSPWDAAQAGVLEAYYVDLCGDFPTSSTIFQYPGFQEGPFGTFEGPGLTYLAPNATGWTSFMPGAPGGYTGPSCGFNTGLGPTNLGTTLSY